MSSERLRERCLLAAVSAFLSAPGFGAAAAGVRSIDLTYVSGGIPFRSHNQKAVQNDNGIFITTGRRDAPTGYQLRRSTDGGQTFTTVYSETLAVNPPTIGTDESNNIYLIYPETDNRRTRFRKFNASNGYSSPVISRTYSEAYSAGKSASAYGRTRGRLCHATQWGHFLAIDKSGNLVVSKHVYTSGASAGPSCPHLFVDETGVIHYAMTTGDAGTPYQTIRYLKSTNGGGNWKAMDGTAVSTPTPCDANGPSTMINLPGEVVYSTWLACMHVKNGKVHFMYLTRDPANPENLGNPPDIVRRQHYMRFNATTGVREIDSWSDWGRWGGKSLHIHAVGGLITSYPADPTGPLFAVGGQGRDGMNKGGRKLVALVSYDNGSTWQDYAVSGDVGLVWAESGSRAVTRDGNVIGTFAGAKPQWATTLFFRFDARPAMLGQGFGEVRLPRLGELKGHLKTAYVHMGRGRYRAAAGTLKPILDRPALHGRTAPD